jgi:hypothetical protein
VRIHCADQATHLYQLKLALTSLTSGGLSVGIVPSQTEAMEFVCCYSSSSSSSSISSSSIVIAVA